MCNKTFCFKMVAKQFLSNRKKKNKQTNKTKQKQKQKF